MARLKYNGPLQLVEVFGFGHFTPGEVKQVDALTAVQFTEPACKAEGWEVLADVEPAAVHDADAPTVTVAEPTMPTRRR